MLSVRKYEKAFSDFQQVIDLNPTDANAYGWRAYAYSALGASEEKIRADMCRHIQLAGANAFQTVIDYVAQQGWQCPASP